MHQINKRLTEAAGWLNEWVDGDCRGRTGAICVERNGISLCLRTTLPGVPWHRSPTIERIVSWLVLENGIMNPLTLELDAMLLELERAK